MLAPRPRKSTFWLVFAVPVMLLGLTVLDGSDSEDAMAERTTGRSEVRLAGASLTGAYSGQELAPAAAPAAQQAPELLPTPPPCGTGSDYVVNRSEGANIDPGVYLVCASQCNQCEFDIAIPVDFAYTFYGQPVTMLRAGDNGTLAFGEMNPNGYSNFCLPRTSFFDAIMPYWDDLTTQASVDPSLGVFYSEVGTAPNRVINIEWRACRYGGPSTCDGPVNFEVQLYESQNRFDIVYGDVTGNGSSATIGVQNDAGSQFTQYACSESDSVQPGTRLSFVEPECGITPTPAGSATATPYLPPPTPTQPGGSPTRTWTPAPPPTATPTVTGTRVTPSATPTPTPYQCLPFPTPTLARPAKPQPTITTPPTPMYGYEPKAASATLDKQPQAVEKAQPFDCSQVDKLNLEKQTNLHAYQLLVQCGRAPQAAPAKAGDAASGIVNRLLSPFAYGGVDVDVILPDGTYPKVTQSESMNWANGATIVNNYNDSRSSSGCYAGISYSTDNGATWTRNNGGGASPICSGHGTNYGDPNVVWNNALNLWFAGDLATGCGGQGIGLWTSPDAVTWTPGACAHSGSSDDRESMWVDNNPASPHYGRMYISWNNFAIGGGALYVTYSDNGTSWTPVQLNASFIRDIQITGDLAGSGTVYVAAMNEGTGGLDTRQNVMYRSTDGGATWTSSDAGPTFYAPGRTTSGYFALVFSTIWRHMGWGQPAAVGNTVHYAWAQCGANQTCSGATDHGDIYYSRSTDAGVTWSTPIKMNSDSGTAMQWQPSMAATEGGAIYVGWYDQREVNSGNDLNCTVGSPTQACYRRYGKVSLDNGATWQTDDATGDVNSPLPAQPDSAVQTTYEGDYDYIVSGEYNGVPYVYDHWTDGRVLINNTSQQDVFGDRIPLLQGTPTPTVTGTPPTNTPTRTPTLTPTFSPTVCGANSNYVMATATATVITGGTDIGNHTDDGVTQITLPFPFRLYDQVYTTVGLDSNGRAIFPTGSSAYSNVCLPSTGDTYTIYPYWDDLYTTNSGYGIFTQVLGSAPNRLFVIYWHAQHFPGSGTVDFNLILHEGQSMFDVIFGSDTAPDSETIGVQKNDLLYTQYLCNTAATNNTKITFSQLGCGTPGTPPATSTPATSPTLTPTSLAMTPTPTTGGNFTPTMQATATSTPPRIPTNTRTSTPSPSPTQPCGDHAPYAATPVPGTTFQERGDLLDGSHCGDCVLHLIPPFPYTLYGQVQNTLDIGVNGNLQFTTAITDAENSCIPASVIPDAIFPYWSDLDTTEQVCGPDCGIYTWLDTSGPERVFGVQWRACVVDDVGQCAAHVEFEVRLYENQRRFDLVYGQVFLNGNDAAIGVNGSSAADASLYACRGSRPVANSLQLTFVQPVCATPTPCPLQFTDVPPENTFYPYVRCLACRGIISGYSDGTFRPNNNVTRGQLSKIVSNAAGFEDDVTGRWTYTDVPDTNTFWLWIERLTLHGVMSGYNCGIDPNEPCDPQNRPYFRPFNNATRGQISKIVSNAAGFSDDPGEQIFADVPPENTFYTWVQRLASRYVMGGYQCGGPGEPCDPQQRPYFRPFNNATRGQTAKIVSNTFYPNCQTPQRR